MVALELIGLEFALGLIAKIVTLSVAREILLAPLVALSLGPRIVAILESSLARLAAIASLIKVGAVLVAVELTLIAQLVTRILGLIACLAGRIACGL